jgi:chemotaxis protein MotB
MALARSRLDRGVNYWPGFVDALSTLILGIVFLLSVFVVVQFFLSQEVTNKETVLSRLNAQIVQLTEMLALEKSGRSSLEDTVTTLKAGLAAVTGDREHFKSLYEGAGAGAASAENKLGNLTKDFEGEKQQSARALAQVELLNQQITALRRQLSALEDALQASEKKDKDAQTRIADLGQRLNIALAQRVQELSRYRSEFFGRLRAVLGGRPDIRVVGDRFVFQSEILFDSGSAALRPDGQPELEKLATALLDLEKQIPPEINWVLRVDGHTDLRPISSQQFPSNWELSAARAIAVVQFLISKGVSPQRLVAAGFGECQPLDAGQSDDGLRRNRRIELKLTER